MSYYPYHRSLRAAPSKDLKKSNPEEYERQENVNREHHYNARRVLPFLINQKLANAQRDDTIKIHPQASENLDGYHIILPPLMVSKIYDANGNRPFRKSSVQEILKEMVPKPDKPMTKPFIHRTIGFAAKPTGEKGSFTNEDIQLRSIPVLSVESMILPIPRDVWSDVFRPYRNLALDCNNICMLPIPAPENHKMSYADFLKNEKYKDIIVPIIPGNLYQDILKDDTLGEALRKAVAESPLSNETPSSEKVFGSHFLEIPSPTVTGAPMFSYKPSSPKKTPEPAKTTPKRKSKEIEETPSGSKAAEPTRSTQQEHARRVTRVQTSETAEEESNKRKKTTDAPETSVKRRRVNDEPKTFLEFVKHVSDRRLLMSWEMPSFSMKRMHEDPEYRDTIFTAAKVCQAYLPRELNLQVNESDSVLSLLYKQVQYQTEQSVVQKDV